MFRFITNSNMPKWLRVILYIFLTVTLVYMLGYAIYKLLDAIRILLHWVSEIRNYWTFIACIIILIIGSLLIAQFALNLDPFGKAYNWVLNLWHGFRDTLGNIIST